MWISWHSLPENARSAARLFASLLSMSTAVPRAMSPATLRTQSNNVLTRKRCRQARLLSCPLADSSACSGRRLKCAAHPGHALLLPRRQHGHMPDQDSRLARTRRNHTGRKRSARNQNTRRDKVTTVRDKDDSQPRQGRDNSSPARQCRVISRHKKPSPIGAASILVK